MVWCGMASLAALRGRHFLVSYAIWVSVSRCSNARPIIVRDESPYQPDAIYACWLTFRLCRIPLLSHLSELALSFAKSNGVKRLRKFLLVPRQERGLMTLHCSKLYPV
jgi:hypothetical protein